MFFSLVFVKEGSRGFAQKKHQTLRLYTLDVLTELKKRLLWTMTRIDRPFSIKRLGFSLTFFFFFQFLFALDSSLSAISRREPIVRAT